MPVAPLGVNKIWPVIVGSLHFSLGRVGEGGGERVRVICGKQKACLERSEEEIGVGINEMCRIKNGDDGVFVQKTGRRGSLEE